MSLIKKIFRAGETKPAAEEPAEDAEPSIGSSKQRNVLRREMILNVMRDTMGKHAIPSDWMACRVLAVTTKQGKAGLHVQFIVRSGDQQLLPYVHAFQEAFWQELERLDHFARQWLFSVAWQFEGRAARDAAGMPAGAAPMTAPAPKSEPADAPAEAGDTVPAIEDAEDLESDLQALYAALKAPADPSGTRKP